MFAPVLGRRLARKSLTWLVCLAWASCAPFAAEPSPDSGADAAPGGDDGGPEGGAAVSCTDPAVGDAIAFYPFDQRAGHVIGDCVAPALPLAIETPQAVTWTP